MGSESEKDKFISKSAKKRRSTALQKLGEELIALPVEISTKLDLPLELEEAIANAPKIREKEAARRHRQYIGRLMRDIDLVELVANLEQKSANSGISSEESMKILVKLRAMLADLG